MQLEKSQNKFIKVILITLMALSVILFLYTINTFKSSTKDFTTQSNLQNQNKMQFSKMPDFKNSKSKKSPKPQNNVRNKNKNFHGNIPGGMKDNNVSNKYAPILTLYTCIFIGICILLLYNIRNKKFKVCESNKKIIVLAVMFIGLFLRLCLGTIIKGYSGDISLFSNWASTAADNFMNFYSSAGHSDYPPLYIYVLSIIGKLGHISLFSNYYTLLLKLPSILADVLTGYFIYKIAKHHVSFEFAALACIFYIFNPAVFIDSTLWGQVDSFFTLLIVASLFLMSKNKIVLSSVIFTCSVLMKPQGIIFLPVLFFHLVKERRPSLFIKSILSALITFVIVILPFSIGKNPIWIFKLYSSTISEYPYASVNGFNFFNLVGANYKDTSLSFIILSYKTWGMAAIIAVTLFSWFSYAKIKRNDFAYLAAFLQITGVFTFSTGMHERYLFPALALCTIAAIYIKEKNFTLLCIGYTITIYFNIYAILFKESSMMTSSSSHSLLGDTISLLNLLLFIYTVKLVINKLKLKKHYQVFN